MVFVTGDTHADMDITKLNKAYFPQQDALTKDDYVIICGDFGLCWDNSKRERWWRDWLSQRSFTTLWIDGNHENFDMLYQFPVTDMFSGKAREIAPSVYHLERGQVLTIGGKKIFCMGGARSVDKATRREHISWWEQEMPTMAEMEQAIAALDAADWNVDYVITHCAPKRVQAELASWYENDPMVSFLDRVCSDLMFKRWYFGHYHVDRNIGDKFVALYNRVLSLGDSHQ